MREKSKLDADDHSSTGSGHRIENVITMSSGPSRLRVSAILTGGIALIVVGALALIFTGATGTSSTVLFVVGAMTWLGAAYNGVFHAHITRDETRIVPVAGLASAGSGVALLAVDDVFGIYGVALSDVIAASAASMASLVAGLLIGRFALRQLWDAGQFRSTAIVVGSGTLSKELALELAHRSELGIDVVDYVAVEADADAVDEGLADRLAGSLRKHRPDRLIVGEIDAGDGLLLPALRLAGTTGTRVYVLPRLFSMGLGNSLFAPDQLRGFPLQRVNRSTHPGLALAMKRAVDIAFSAMALTFLSPILITAAIAVKLTSPGELLFWQERVGRSGEAIRIPKFRSMSSSETSDVEWTADDRTTTVGRFLRRTAIDELPQLWSVLRGDMSLVGPRPERPAFVTRFAAEHVDYASRHRMRAGLTGLAQVAGLRGDTSISERAKFDNLYIDQWSLTGDFLIMIRTIGAIIGERSRSEAQLDLAEALSSLQDLEPTFVIDATGHRAPKPEHAGSIY